MKRFLSVFMVSVFLFAFMEIAASAASSSAPTVVKPSRINVYASSTTLRVGHTRDLDYRVYTARESDVIDIDRVSWDVEDPNILYVDEFGEITGSQPGETTVTVTLYGPNSAGKIVRLGTGSINIKVVSNVVGNETTSGNSKSGSAEDRKLEESFLGGKIPSAKVTEAVKAAIKKGESSVTFRDTGSISAAALHSAALLTEKAGVSVKLNFDTMVGNSVEGRVTIDPALSGNLVGDVDLGVFSSQEATMALNRVIGKTFKNRIYLVKTEQVSGYGMPVTYAAKLGTIILREKNIKVYSYSMAKGTYSEVKDADVSLDMSGYAHFTTSKGGWFIISDGTLTEWGH